MNTYKGSVYIFIYLILVCGNISAFAATLVVPTEHPTIQSGIDAAVDGDTVLVRDGSYKGDGNVNIDFKGKRITVKSLNGAKHTKIHCRWKENTRGFIFQNSETNDTVLEGFTISNGKHDFGGGIFFNGASPTIKDCVITWNSAKTKDRFTGRGGGIYVLNSDVKIIGCTISNNWSDSYGGGIYLEGHRDVNGDLRDQRFQPSIINCTVTDNKGSGVYSIEYVRTTILNSEISKNKGRGVVNTFVSRGSQITNCLISLNTEGGIECSDNSSMMITKTIIKQNIGEIGGGIFCSSTSSIDVSDCIIAQNIATDSGGGIGVLSTNGDAVIANCTIVRNSANHNGGGLYAFIEGSFFSLTKSILWGNNSNETNPEFSGIGGRISISFCDIRDGLEGIEREPDGKWFIYEDNIDEDPLFVDVDRGDYKLKRHSPAENMGAQSHVGRSLSVSSVGKKLTLWADLKRK